MKTNFKARPIYHYKDNRIKAHFISCFLALLIYRILDYKLDFKYSISEVLDALKGMNVCPINEAQFKGQFSSSKLIKELDMIFNKSLDRNDFTNTILNKNKK
jgi:transposase